VRERTPPGIVVEVVVFQPDRAVRDWEETGDGPRDRAFAGAGFANKSKGLTRRDSESHTGHGRWWVAHIATEDRSDSFREGAAVVGDGEVLDCEQRLGVVRCPVSLRYGLEVDRGVVECGYLVPAPAPDITGGVRRDRD
jgi:hypothetical protein